MKVLIVHPQINSILAYSYGVGYLVSVLKTGGHSVDCFILTDLRDILLLYKKVQEQKPDIIGFSLLTSEFGYMSDVIKGIREVSDAFIICGGIHPTLQPECISQIEGVDAIVRGEGEYPLLELANSLEHKDDFLRIKNLWFKKDGKIIKNDLRPPINLDELPFPDKGEFYQSIIDRFWGINRFIFSRGCPFDCSYCSNKALREMNRGKGPLYRFLSPKKAIEIIALDSERYKFSTIFFDDDLITLDKKWFYEFFGLYKKQFNYPFYCNIRAGVIEAEMVKLLKEAGCKGIAIGVEHGNETFRKNVLKRDISDELLVNTVKLFKDHKIEEVHGHVMVGIPCENMELFLDTVRLFRRLRIRLIKFIYSPLPGTDLGELCREKGWLPRQAYYYERIQAVIDYPDFSAKEIQLCFDVLSILLKFRFLPIKLPGISTKTLFKLYRILFDFVLYPDKKIIGLIGNSRSLMMRSDGK